MANDKCVSIELKKGAMTQQKTAHCLVSGKHLVEKKSQTEEKKCESAQKLVNDIEISA